LLVLEGINYFENVLFNLDHYYRNRLKLETLLANTNLLTLRETFIRGISLYFRKCKEIRRNSKGILSEFE